MRGKEMTRTSPIETLAFNLCLERVLANAIWSFFSEEDVKEHSKELIQQFKANYEGWA